jgi:DNA (cytosine-5)-methyltransferase 1
VSRPRLLDLFCGAGGAAMGYHRAGFDVIGVDIEPQPRYPFEFHQADALEFPLGGFDVIHASPLCQMWSAYRRARPEKGDEHYVNLIPQTRERLIATGLPYIIENVEGARFELINPVRLCGTGFALDVERHRRFESNVPLIGMPCAHGRNKARFPRGSRHIRPNDRRTVAIGEWRIPVPMQQAAIGIDWMTVPEMSQAIPPAYTEFLGRQVLDSSRYVELGTTISPPFPQVS